MKSENMEVENMEVENFKIILNEVQIENNKNSLSFLIYFLRTTDVLPLQKMVLEGLLHYYELGYIHFQNIEWGIKNIDSLNHKDRVVTKPYGNLLSTIYNLCKECHTLQNASGVDIPYKNAYRWFMKCMLELPLYDLEYMTIVNDKSHMVQMWKERIDILKGLEYPPDVCDYTGRFKPYKPEYNPFINSTFTKYSSGLILLIESAYSLTALFPDFEKKYWKPFIQAQKDIVDTLESSKYLIDMKILPKTEEYQTKKKGKGIKFTKSKKLK